MDRKVELFSIIDSIIREETDEELNPEFTTAFTNLLLSHIKITARDLESFSKHSKRSVINSDDVKLLTRRNEDLEAKISEFIRSNKKEKERE